MSPNCFCYKVWFTFDGGPITYITYITYITFVNIIYFSFH